MWDFFETVRHRHSVRKYRAEMPVEPEKLHGILEMSCAAPSAGDLQSYCITVVTVQAERQALADAAGQPFIADAPVVLVFSSDPDRAATKYGERGRQLYAVQDTTIAATYAQLAVVAAGLGSAWIGHFDEARITELLRLDPHCTPIAMLTIGYPAELPEPTPRRPLQELVVYR